ncbi:MAG: hypothetical protein ABSE73_12810 [Planctomycetota bacterium]
MDSLKDKTLEEIGPTLKAHTWGYTLPLQSLPADLQNVEWLNVCWAGGFILIGIYERLMESDYWGTVKGRLQPEEIAKCVVAMDHQGWLWLMGQSPDDIVAAATSPETAGAKDGKPEAPAGKGKELPDAGPPCPKRIGTATHQNHLDAVANLNGAWFEIGQLQISHNPAATTTKLWLRTMRECGFLECQGKHTLLSYRVKKMSNFV